MTGIAIESKTVNTIKPMFVNNVDRKVMQIHHRKGTETCNYPMRTSMGSNYTHLESINSPTSNTSTRTCNNTAHSIQYRTITHTTHWGRSPADVAPSCWASCCCGRCWRSGAGGGLTLALLLAPPLLRAALFSTAVTGEPVVVSPLCTEALFGAGGVAGEAPVPPVDGCFVAFSDDSAGTGMLLEGCLWSEAQIEILAS